MTLTPIPVGRIDGFVLTQKKAGRNVTGAYPGMFLIGFFVADESNVERINSRLRADGFDVAAP